jgi:hypothetical protein
MRPPPSPSTPMICIGPGTGVAPMRALIEDRASSGATGLWQHTPRFRIALIGVTDNTLYFGCRSASKDQHFSADWITLADSGHLTYRLAASRDGPPGQARTYVQHLIEADAASVARLVAECGAHVYISGYYRFLLNVRKILNTSQILQPNASSRQVGHSKCSADGWPNGRGAGQALREGDGGDGPPGRRVLELSGLHTGQTSPLLFITKNETPTMVQPACKLREPDIFLCDPFTYTSIIQSSCGFTVKELPAW